MFQYFPDFVDQQLKIWDEKNSQVDTNRKKIIEIASPSIQMIGNMFYWIAGTEEIHLLYHERTADSGYAKKLDREEIDQLPVEVVYVGPDSHAFVDDEEKAFSNLVGIIARMNLMQDQQFVSFPLGKKLLKIIRLQHGCTKHTFAEDHGWWWWWWWWGEII